MSRCCWLLFTHLTHDRTTSYSQFADDTAVLGLISNSDHISYRDVGMTYLNVGKTKEMIVYFIRSSSDHSPLSSNGATVEQMKTPSSVVFTWQKTPPGQPTQAHSLRDTSQLHLHYTHPQNLLWGHHQEHPDQLHHYLLQELPSLWLQSSAKGCADSGADHWCLLPRLQEIFTCIHKVNHIVTNSPTPLVDCSPPFHLGESFAASGAGLPQCAIISSPK